MSRYIAQRIGSMILALFTVSMIVFFIMELPPGDYAERYIFRKYSGTGVVATESDVQNIRITLGLDRPAFVRYADWIWGITTRFDFGESFAFETSVNDVIADRLALTLVLLIATLLLTYAVAIPVGIFAAIRRRSAADYSLSIVSYLGLAIPNFLLALILLYVGVTVFDIGVGGLFSQEFQGAPFSAAKLWDLILHMAVPALVLSWSATALQLQTVRATMLDEINKPYVTAARARGLSERKLLLKYPARAAINPVVSTMGFDVNRIFSELPIVALILSLPELGDLLIKAFLDLDMYVAGAVLLLLTAVIIFMNFVSDMVLAVLDPRVRRAM